MPDGDERERGALTGLVTQAVGLSGRLNRLGWSIARRVPGGLAAEAVVKPVEQAVATEVQRRLRGLGLLDGDTDGALDHAGRAGHAVDATGARLVETRSGDYTVTAVVRPVGGEPEPLRAAMAELLTRSVEQTREQSEQQLFAGILRQLVPDQARMLAALSDGSAYPLVNIASRTALGGAKRVVLENASTVGKAAGAQLSANTPTFVGHLLRLGLVDIGPEDPTLDVQYDILLTDDLVRVAEDEARRDGRGAPRVQRQTVRMSALGRRFWDACHPTRQSLPGSSGPASGPGPLPGSAG